MHDQVSVLRRPELIFLEDPGANVNEKKVLCRKKHNKSVSRSFALRWNTGLSCNSFCRQPSNLPKVEKSLCTICIGMNVLQCQTFFNIEN